MASSATKLAKEPWNEAHSSDRDEVDLADPAVVQARLDRINADPRLTH